VGARGIVRRHATFSHRDSNEPEIILALELAGWKVFPLRSTGWPDLLCARHGVVQLVEVKGPKGKLKPAQAAFFPRLKAAGLSVAIVRTAEEARSV
jgi:VRR-NUC domain-containing protein